MTAETVPAPTQPPPAMGQIWRDLDHRPERFVRIEAVFQSAFIRTVARAGDGWVSPPRSQSRTVDPGRFNGKRGGYEFVEGPQ